MKVTDLEALYDAKLRPTDPDAKALAPKTVLEIHLIIRGALTTAVERRILARNVATVAHAPRLRSIPKHEAQAWTADQLTMFLRAAVGHRLFPAFWLAADTGGGPVHPRSVSQGVERVARNRALPVIRFHDLRHTHATLLIKEGVPVKVVSERLGHATTAFTIETYQHVLLGMQADAARLFAGLIDPSTGDTRWKTREKSA